MMRRLAPLPVLLVALACLPTLAQRSAQDPSKDRPQPPLLLRNPTVSKTDIVFAYADDLWIVPRAGGEAKRLTSGPGVETDPVFSPDGSQVAFTGQYDGNEDVYVVPARGGEPKRLTYHPALDQPVGWTPDGKQVLFRSRRNAHAPLSQLFTIGTDGGHPQELPLPMADHGCYSPDGKRLCYAPFVNTPRRIGVHVAWKRYRGGNAPMLWIADLATSRIEKLPRKDSNDTHPMWIGDRIYFLSDRDGPNTLFAYDLQTKEVEKVIDNKGQEDIRTASAGPGAIVYEKPGAIYLYDLEVRKSVPVPVTIRADLGSVRPRFVKVAEQIQKAALSPTGARALFEARGDIFTVPADKGDARNLTRTSGVAERDPAWSPDGKSIAYFSDESGEYELHVAPQRGTGKVKKFKPGGGSSFFYSPVWSPDSKKIAYTDKRLNIWYLDLDTGLSKKVDTNPYAGGIGTPSWSPDGKWLAYTRQLKSYLSAVFLYSLQTGKPAQLSDGMSDVAGVQFDKGGKYLYFTASTDAGPSQSSQMSSLNRPVTRSVYVVVLAADTPSPLAPESDEEKDAEKPKPDKPKDEKPKADQDKKKAAGAVKVKIDLEDVDQRILALPVPARNYIGLLAGKEGSLFLVEGPAVARSTRPTPGGPGQILHRFDLKTRKLEKRLEGISSVAISDNGEKLLYRQGTAWHIVPAQAQGGQGGQGGTGAAAPAARGGPGQGGPLKLTGLEVRVDPRAEWKQIYREVWRIQRDFLYDPGFHGLDIKKQAARYQRFLPGIASRHDLNNLFEEMLGDLVLGHVYIGGGDIPSVRGPGGGLLGADFKIEDGRYRITRIYRGENWNPELRAPLTQPGARVKEGEFLLAIDGEELKGSDSVYRLLEGKANRSVTLKVGPTADGKGAREVTVVPVGNETSLRHFAWVTDNRKKVDQMTRGRVAYIYLPNTHAAGHDRFVREFYAQVGKDAVIIDERFNGGGFLADQVIDALNQRPRNYVASREGADSVFPRGIFGPKVMLINEAAGSGGDYLPYTFRQARLGKLVGKRTWGGLVGIGGYPRLIDGGSVTAPHWALYFPNGKWDVENVGVAPDVEVEFDPQVVRGGRDPQLEKAVQIALDELKKNPPKKVQRPAYPNYHKKAEE
jgi:tricorn protease